jgi:hypothetical protein
MINVDDYVTGKNMMEKYRHLFLVSIDVFHALEAVLHNDCTTRRLDPCILDATIASSFFAMDKLQDIGRIMPIFLELIKEWKIRNQSLFAMYIN